MTPEEGFERIERQIEFVAAHQGELSASLKTLRDSVSGRDVQIAQLTDVVTSLAHIAAEQGQRIDEGFARLTEARLRADERGRRTDERLNALINAVERYFPNGRK